VRALATVALAAALHVPHGYQAHVYATGLKHPTAMAFGPDGRLYVTEDGGAVMSVTRGASRPRAFLTNLTVPLGLLWRGRTLYVSESGKVEAFRAGRRRLVVGGLPYGRHQQDAIVAGPDGRLYLGSGSTCDACVEEDPRSAAILSFRTDGSDLRVVAHGLRNPYGLVFVGRTLYATINGRDDLGDGEPAEEVVRVRRLAVVLGELRVAEADRLVRRRHPAGRVPGAAFVGRRDRLLARRPLRHRVGRIPVVEARACARAHQARPRDDVRDRLRPSARARRRPQRRPVGRRLGPRRHLCDQEVVTYAVRDSVWPLISFMLATTV
jgi:hypothetical protein